jgi:catechol 2,3-dioxygenase-like lactoylglutathione lyase family enzyme
MFVEGEFIDTVIGIPLAQRDRDAAAPRRRNGGEVARFVRPAHEPGRPEAMANVLGLRNVGFEVDDLQAILDRLAGRGYGLVGGVGEYEHVWRMAHVRGPEGIVVTLSQRIG